MHAMKKKSEAFNTDIFISWTVHILVMTDFFRIFTRQHICFMSMYIVQIHNFICNLTIKVTMFIFSSSSFIYKVICRYWDDPPSVDNLYRLKWVATISFEYPTFHIFQISLFHFVIRDNKYVCKFGFLHVIRYFMRIVSLRNKILVSYLDLLYDSLICVS